VKELKRKNVELDWSPAMPVVIVGMKIDGSTETVRLLCLKSAMFFHM